MIALALPKGDLVRFMSRDQAWRLLPLRESESARGGDPSNGELRRSYLASSFSLRSALGSRLIGKPRAFGARYPGSSPGSPVRRSVRSIYEHVFDGWQGAAIHRGGGA